MIAAIADLGRVQILAAASDPSTEASFDWAPLVWGAAAVLAVVTIAAALLVQRMREAARKNSPAVLFSELCRAHKLDRPQRTLLKQVAQRQKLPDSARVFTEPQWLLQAQADGAFRSRAGQLQALCQMLFEKSEQ
jgi:hypothetical protein